MVGGDLRKACLLSGVEVGGERDHVGEGTYPLTLPPSLLPPSPCHPPASSCRFPTPLSALTDPAWNRGPSPAALSDPLFTEGRVCLKPELGKWRAGVEGRIFSITAEIRDIRTYTLKREVIWSPKKAIKQTRSVGIRDQNCEVNRLSGLRQVTFNPRASFSLLQAGAVLELINFAGCLEIHDQRLEQGRRRFCVAVTLVPRKMKASSFFYHHPPNPHTGQWEKVTCRLYQVFTCISLKPCLSRVSEHRYWVILVTFSVGLSCNDFILTFLLFRNFMQGWWCHCLGVGLWWFGFLGYSSCLVMILLKAAPWNLAESPKFDLRTEKG